MARRRLVYRQRDMEKYWETRFKLGFNEQDSFLNFMHNYVKNYDQGEYPLNKESGFNPGEIKLGYYKKNRKT